MQHFVSTFFHIKYCHAYRRLPCLSNFTQEDNMVNSIITSRKKISNVVSFLGFNSFMIFIWRADHGRLIWTLFYSLVSLWTSLSLGRFPLHCSHENLIRNSESPTPNIKGLHAICHWMASPLGWGSSWLICLMTYNPYCDRIRRFTQHCCLLNELKQWYKNATGHDVVWYIKPDVT